MAESQHVYYAAQCPECLQRACVTQAVDYEADSEAARRVCPDALDGEIKCRGPCCHGCECVQTAECLETECDCDCHCTELRIFGAEAMDEDDRCRCHVCRHGIAPIVEYQTGYDGGEGHWVSNRPRECRHFLEPGPNVISTFYDNSDRRNHRLERFFFPVTAGPQPTALHERLLYYVGVAAGGTKLQQRRVLASEAETQDWLTQYGESAPYVETMAIVEERTEYYDTKSGQRVEKTVLRADPLFVRNTGGDDDNNKG